MMNPNNNNLYNHKNTLGAETSARAQNGLLVPSTSAYRNKIWCHSCQRVFSSLNVNAIQSVCPCCRNIGYPLINWTSVPRPLAVTHTSEFIHSLDRSLFSSRPSQPSQPALPFADSPVRTAGLNANHYEPFSITPFRRRSLIFGSFMTPRNLIPLSLNFTRPSEPTLPSDQTVNSPMQVEVDHHTIDGQSENNHQQDQSEEPINNDSHSNERGSRPIRQLSELMILAQLIGRLFRSLESRADDISTSDTESHDDVSESESGLPGRHSVNRDTSHFPLVIFTIGTISRDDDSDLDQIIQSLLSTRSQGKKPASAEAIQSLERFNYGDPSHNDAKEECAVCQYDYKHGDELVKLPCSHDYHKDCVVKWLEQNDSCPSCRRSIEVESTAN